jgi:hypothetical protein
MFCDECGHKITLPSEPPPKELSFSEKIEKIQRYLPQGLTEKILSQKDRIEGERKQVTVMFCDMEGFTPLSELLGIEEAYSIMDQVYEILIHKVHDYEGTVNEMTGDGIMALFGAPVALEDAPQRAIRSSLAIHREMAKFSDQLKAEKKDALQNGRASPTRNNLYNREYLQTHRRIISLRGSGQADDQRQGKTDPYLPCHCAQYQKDPV